MPPEELPKLSAQQLSTKIAEEKIAILFISLRTPEEYLQYVKARIDEFEGALVCARGRFTALCAYLVPEIVKYFQGQLGIKTPYVKTFARNITKRRKHTPPLQIRARI
jgi:hypothetical protein